MKEMEYTIKVLTNGPVDPASLVGPLTDVVGVKAVDLVTFRVKPTPRDKKA